MLKRLALLFVVVLITAQPADAQRRPGMPPRDRPSGPETGTAVISGRITAAETGTPLRRAIVRVSGRELRTSRSTMTDPEGRYLIGELPAGSHNVSADKGGYVQAQYGQKTPNTPGRTLTLADGQKLENLDIGLYRGGVITGFVSDEFGEPIADARVQVLRLRWMNGQRRPMPAGRGSTTNDRGEFRIWGLSPGEYFVAATAGDRGYFDDESGDRAGYTPTYFPGTPSLEEAQRVSVAAGQESAGVSFALTLTRTVRISGTAVGSDGRPMTDGMVAVLPRTGGSFVMGPSSGGRLRDGTFTVGGVAPGEYTIQARTMGRRGVEEGEVAIANIVVAGEDISNLVLVATKGVRMTGRIRFDAAPDEGTLARLRVFLPPVEFGAGIMGRIGQSPVTAQGAFELEDLQPGRRRVVLENLPKGWAISAVRVGGVDVADTGVEIGKEDITGVEIQVTNRLTSVTGSVRDDRNDAATSYVVLVFSTDERHWELSMGSRRINAGRPDQNGVYRIEGLAPGSYFAVAVSEMPEEWGNPELMERLIPLAERFSLNEGESKSLDLTLQTVPALL
jgi:hypothetical protein